MQHRGAADTDPELYLMNRGISSSTSSYTPYNSSDNSKFPFVPIESEIPIEHEISSKYSLVYPIKTGNSERFTLNVCSQFNYNMLYSNTLNKYHPGIIILLILAGLHEN